MTPTKLPLVFRIAAALLIVSAVVGQWWQQQPAGPSGRGFLATVARMCPAAVVPIKNPTIADTAHALDRAGFTRLRDLVLRDGHDRCHLGARHRTRRHALGVSQ